MTLRRKAARMPGAPSRTTVVVRFRTATTSAAPAGGCSEAGRQSFATGSSARSPACTSRTPATPGDMAAIHADHA